MFANKKIQGIRYDLSHLSPMTFTVSVPSRTITVAARFSCHAFTEAHDPAVSPDWHYSHEGEKRTFSIARYAFSHHLPFLIRNLPQQTVYHTRQENFFFLRTGLEPHLGDPYVGFFSLEKATKSAAFDVLLRVQSAYPKREMAQRASPVSFVNLVNAVFTRKPLKIGKPQTIKRK